MTDIVVTRIHELTVILYAFSVLFYFIDFLHHNRKVNRIAFWLLLFVWFFQSISLYLYVIETKRFPVLTFVEGLYFYVWIIISFSLILNRFLKVDFIVFFSNVIGFIFMVIHIFAPNQIHSNYTAQLLVSELLFIHITAAIFSYGAFSLSFVLSILYILQYHLLKQKKWGKRLMRLADLSKLENMSYTLTLVGVPILIIGVILGGRWAYLKLPNMPWFDPKVIGSVSVLFIYCYYLYLRLRKGIAGRTLALWNVAAFLVLLINFFLIGNFSTFHLWL